MRARVLLSQMSFYSTCVIYGNLGPSFLRKSDFFLMVQIHGIDWLSTGLILQPPKVPLSATLRPYNARSLEVGTTGWVGLLEAFWMAKVAVRTG